MSFIRYRYKSEKDFNFFQFASIDCSVGQFKQFLLGTPSKCKSHRPRDKIEFIIIDASTNKEYCNDRDLIPSCTSVIVIRKLYESFEPLTSQTVQHQSVSIDDINGITELISKAKSHAYDNKPVNMAVELELIKKMQKPSHPTNRPAFKVCHNCKQRGHIYRYCPLLVGSLKSSMKRAINIIQQPIVDYVPSKCISHVVNENRIKQSFFNKDQTNFETSNIPSACISFASSS